MTFEKNQIIEAEIINVAFEGHGIAKPSGFTVFVPKTMPGDVVRMRLDRVKKSHAFATLIEVITKSPDRITPPCPYFDVCGGCHYQHMSAETSQSIKASHVQEAFERLGPGPIQQQPMVTGKDPLGYRNRITLARGKNGTQGFVSIDGSTIVDIDTCIIAAPDIQAFWKELAPILAPINEKVLPYVTLRSTGKERICICYVTPDFSISELLRRVENMEAMFYVSVIQKGASHSTAQKITPLRDEPIFLEINVGSHTFMTGPELFFQNNYEVANQLIDAVTNIASKFEGPVLDLYCGSGFFSVPLAKKGMDVVGVEVQKRAISCAKQSSMLEGVEEKATFKTSDVEKQLAAWVGRDRHFPLVIADPPRKGFSAKAIENLMQLGMETLVYVSCNPATLARDAKILKSLGFEAKQATPFEMFPQTYHLETLAVFEKSQ